MQVSLGDDDDIEGTNDCDGLPLGANDRMDGMTEDEGFDVGISCTQSSMAK